MVFAILYLDALEQWNRRDAPPGPWAVAFESATDRRATPWRRNEAQLERSVEVGRDQIEKGRLTVDERHELAAEFVVVRRGLALAGILG